MKQKALLKLEVYQAMWDNPFRHATENDSIAQKTKGDSTRKIIYDLKNRIMQNDKNAFKEIMAL